MNGNLMNEFLKRVRDRRGLDNLAAQRALKRYLDEISDSQFGFDIQRVESRGLFNYLIAAGLSKTRLIMLADYERRM